MFSKIKLLLTSLLTIVSVVAFGNPTGGDVINGSAEIRVDGNTTTINQLTGQAIINWDDFSIAPDELTRFVQPDVYSAVLNRVISENPSEIYGKLESNGMLYLVNPNGIVVGPSGVINTGGFIGSTLDIEVEGDNIKFVGDSKASIINQGQVKALDKGIFIVAREVKNSGTISALKGDIALIGADTEVLVVDRGEKVIIRPDAQGYVENTGTIEGVAAGLLAAGGNSYALAINQEGIMESIGTLVIEEVRAADGSLISRTEDGTGGVGLLAQNGDIHVNGTMISKHVTKDGVAYGGDVSIMGSGNIEIGLDTVIDVVGHNGGDVLFGDIDGFYESTPKGSLRIHDGSKVMAYGTAGDGGEIEVFTGDAYLHGMMVTGSHALEGVYRGGEVTITATGDFEMAKNVDLRSVNGRNGNFELHLTKDVSLGAEGQGDVFIDKSWLDEQSWYGNVLVESKGNVFFGKRDTDLLPLMCRDGNKFEIKSEGQVKFMPGMRVAVGNEGVFKIEGTGISLIDTQIKGEGTAQISLHGDKGGAVNIVGSSVLVNDGKLGIVGHNNGVGDFRHGILVERSTLGAEGRGSMTLVGSGSAIRGANSCMGICLQNDARIFANGGNIALSGIGGGAGDFNHGIGISHDASITANDGSLSMDGTAGFGNHADMGIYIGEGGRLITTSNIDLTGTSRDVGEDNYSILIDDGAVVRGTSLATHNQGNPENPGVKIAPGSEIKIGSE